MADYPRGNFFEDFEVGQEFPTCGRTITEGDVLSFAGLSGDFNPLHLDEEFAKQSPFKTRIPHGLCIISIATGLIDKLGVVSGNALAFLELKWKFFKPVMVGDTIRVIMKVLEKRVRHRDAERLPLCRMGRRRDRRCHRGKRVGGQVIRRDRPPGRVTVLAGRLDRFSRRHLVRARVRLLNPGSPYHR